MLRRERHRNIEFGRRAEPPPLVRDWDEDMDLVEAQPYRRRSLWASPVLWCCLGFLFGAPFWHLIGYWSYLTGSPAAFMTSKLSRPAGEPAATPAKPLAAPSTLSPLRTAQPGRKNGPLAQVNCTALVLDRDSGTVQAAQCKANAPGLAELSGRAKGDLLAQAWPRREEFADAGERAATSPWHITVLESQGGAGPAN
jgi:hypothetical protein